jgi:RND family efflux transporter MFP subunit
MSLSMWTWRVVLPVLGAAIAAVVLWQGRGREFDTHRPQTSSTAHATAPKRPARRRVVAEGRVVARPDAEVVVSTELGGTIASVPAQERAAVRKGDLLVELRSDDQRAAQAEAKARLDEADAEYRFHQRDYARRQRTSPRVESYPAELEGARRDLEVAAARRDAAAAALARAQSAVDRARITAPIDGIVVARFSQAGATVAPGARLVHVVDLSRLRIEAEVDEFDIPRVAPGAEATITAEGYRGSSWRGTVEEVPDRVVDRRVSPEDPGRPSDSRVLPVKIALKRTTPLKLGQRVEVEIAVPQ